MSRKERRGKLQIYYDILSAIDDESTQGDVKPTRIQFRTNTAYDKLQSYLTELEGIQLVTTNPLFVTQKGRQFIIKYHDIDSFIREIWKNWTMQH